MERFLDPARLKSSLADLLSLSTMTVATSGSDGEAHAADVYFASDEQLTLYFFSDSNSQHGVDIRRDPRAAITIHAGQGGWEQILGLQMRGVINAISDQALWQQAWDVYRVKFPFVSELEDVVAINQLYGFNPYWMRLVDNSQGFGFNQEWKIENPERDGGPGRVWQQISGQNKGTRKANG